MKTFAFACFLLLLHRSLKVANTFLLLSSRSICSSPYALSNSCVCLFTLRFSVYILVYACFSKLHRTMCFVCCVCADILIFSYIICVWLIHTRLVLTWNSIVHYNALWLYKYIEFGISEYYKCDDDIRRQQLKLHNTQ